MIIVGSENSEGQKLTLRADFIPDLKPDKPNIVLVHIGEDVNTNHLPRISKNSKKREKLVLPRKNDDICVHHQVLPVEMRGLLLGEEKHEKER